MAHIKHQVEADINVNDKASPALKVITAAAGRMNHAFEHATNLVGTFAGGLAAGAAAFEMGDAIKETSAFIRQIDRMAVISKMPVARTEALVRVFEKAGVNAGEVEGIMFRLNRQADKLDFRMDSTGKAIKTGPLAMMEQMGISLRDGPDKAMIALADKVKSGRVDVSRLASTFWLSKDKAYDLHKVLVMGGAQLKKNLEEAKKHNIVNATLLAANKKFVQAQRDMKLGWEHIKQAFGAAMIPVLADLTEKIAQNMDHWVEKAREFGSTLGKFLKEHHRSILNIGKLLAAQFTLQKLTGRGAVGLMAGLWGGGRALAGVLGAGGAAGAAGGAGGAAGAAGAAGAGGAAAAGAGIAATAGVVLAVLAAIALVVGGIYATWKGISLNVNGVRDALTETWDRIAVHLLALWDGVKSVATPVLHHLDKVFSKQGGFGKFMLTLLPAALLGFLKTVELALHGFRALIEWLTIMRGQVSEVAAIFRAAWTDLSAMGGVVVNKVTELFGRFKAYLAEGDATVRSFFSAVWDVVKGLASTIIEPIKLIGSTMLDQFLGWLKPVTSVLGSVFGGIFNTLTEGAGLIFGELYRELREAASVIGGVVMTLFSKIREGVALTFDYFRTSWIGKKLGAAQEQAGAIGKAAGTAVSAVVDPFVNRIATAGDLVVKSFSPVKAIGWAWDRIEDQTRRDLAARRKAREEEKRTEPSTERERAPYNDFRGSKFDITQKFAEGFDPDRIAVAFANDLAAMGERKLQSGFSPIYSSM